MQESLVQSLGQEAPLEKEMAMHSSILAWEIPRTEEPGLQLMESRRVRHDCMNNTFTRITEYCTAAKSLLTLCNLWTVTHQVSLSMGFFSQERWSGLVFPSPGDLSNPGIKPETLITNLHWPVGSLPLVLPGDICYY